MVLHGPNHVGGMSRS